MTYELWDTSSRNIVGDYATADEAFAIAREVLRVDGPNAVESLLLAHEDRHGRTRLIAAGAELAERAGTAAPAPAIVSGGARERSSPT